MSLMPDALWLNVSPALRGFDRPLLKLLAQSYQVAEWQYSQSLDEPLCLDTAITLLHDYLKHGDRPVHLLGHGTSGLVGLLYARRFPHRVRSLTLLSVGVYPAVDWQAHYYAQLQLLQCPREFILTQMVYSLIGYQSRPIAREFVQRLKHDLDTSLSPHSLYHRLHVSPGGVDVPLLVCASDNDIVVDPHQREGWSCHFKEGDRLWSYPDGRYFFHYFHPHATRQAIVSFWQSLSNNSVLSCSPGSEIALSVPMTA